MLATRLIKRNEPFPTDIQQEGSAPNPSRPSDLVLCLCQWVPEISHHCPRTPFLLVGTQVDLREDGSTIEKLAKNKQRPLYPESGEKLARELRAVKYVECSALTQVWGGERFSCLEAFEILS